VPVAVRLLPALAVVLALAAGCTAAPPSAAGAGDPSGPSGPAGDVTGTPGATATPSRPPSATPRPTAGAAGCRIFPADNVWHADVSRLPVHRNSAAYVASIGSTRGVHADFGSGLWEGGPIGIPITNVPAGQGGVRVSFEYASESDRVTYPIPRGAKIEGGPSGDGDRHIILFDRNRCRSYELFAAYPRADGSWRAGSGAVFDLRANALRPRGWTSADAAGLSILAGLVRYEEIIAGRIDHAIRVTAPDTRDAYVWPARHAASDSGDAALPPMGLRLRLKSSVDTSGLPRQARIVAEAMKRYGVILADNGSPWFISGAPDERWDNDALRALGRLKGSDFEAVDASGLMADPNSAAVR
jgi:hypothetical protein